MKNENNLPTGLSLEEVEKRTLEGQVNIVKSTNLKSVRKIITDNVFSYFNLILAILAILLISIRSYENLVFLVIAIINTIIGIFQEIKTRNTIKELSLLSASTVEVVREQTISEILIEQIVLGDIYHVVLGNQIVSDATIQSGQITVNESNLTGESDPIIKTVGDSVLSGSYIVSGDAYLEVTAVGKDNYIEQLSSKVKRLGAPSSEILNSLRKLLKWIGIIIIPLGILTFINVYKTSNFDYMLDFLHDPVSYQTALKKMAGAMIAMVPSGLFLLTTVTFANSVVKLSKHHTSVQEQYAIETLARVDLVCLDKTGTITDGLMQVDGFYPLESLTEEELQNLDYKRIISSMNYALNDQNQTAEAMRKFFGSKRLFRAKNILPFDSSRKYAAVQFDEGVYAYGAPEMIYKGKYGEIRKEAEKLAKQGKRVLLFAKASSLSNDKITAPVAIGFIAINDHIRESAKATLDEFREAGVDIKVISGDNALTVSEVANRAGVKDARKYLSLEKIDDDKLREICHKYTVFGRVSPEQKKILIQEFKNQGKKVAMIGDGVNDILALKESNCSIALASGADAAINISHLVLLNNDFSSLPQVVKEGRQIVSNMQNASVLYLVKTLYTILLAVILLLTSNIYPFEPVQMIVIETFIIGVPSFFLALEPNTARFEGKFMRKVMKQVIPGSLLVIANLVGVYVFASFWTNITEAEISTVGIIAATFAYLLVLVKVSSPLNKRRSIIVLSSLFISLISFTLFGSYFKLTALSVPSFLLLFLLMETTYLIMSIFKKDLIKFWP
ncbi:MAG: HAD-IC family P-type ATPase [Candidatus Izemoplasmatales bacterium]